MSLLEMADELHTENTQGSDPADGQRRLEIERFIRYKLDNWNILSNFERYDAALKVLLEVVLDEKPIISL